MIDVSGSARLALILLAAAAVSASEPALARSAAAAGSARFVCDGGTRFSATWSGERARITTSRGSWLLARRPSSIGRKFQSDLGTFIHDHDMAALNGIPGGPFRGCREDGALVTRERR